MADAETFQHYEVLKNPDGSICELGRGAMGVTYKAFDTNLRALVALKVVNAAFLDNEVARQRFQREARVAAGLRHPNVAGVFHLGEEGGNYFYAMEFIDGETLEAFVRRKGPLAPTLALGLTLQVVRALRAAARVGLVHRDLKPSNLMLSREDEADADEDLHVKVIDFGLAKVAREEGGDASASLTGSGILGTPHYISPEQLEEKPLDARSDIYSLGITLWYMLVGKPPYSGSLMQVMTKHLTEPPPFEQLDSQPPVVRDLLRHMLEKDPDKRPQTPSALRQEIEAALRTLGAPPPPTTAADASLPAGGSAPGSSVLPIQPPKNLVPIAPPKKAAPATEPGTAAPIQIVTRDLTPRGAVPAPVDVQRQKSTGTGTKVAVVLAVVLLVLAAVAFALSRMPKRYTARNILTLNTSPTPQPSVTAVPDATPARVTATPLPVVPRPTASPLEQALSAAKAPLDAGQPDEALLAFNKVLDDFPDEPAVRGGIDASLRALRSTQQLPPDIRQSLSPQETARFEKTRPAAERAASSGSDVAMLYVGDHLIHTEPAVAAAWYRKAVAMGQPEAMHQLGNMHRRGIGTAAETADYAHWFQEAADKGYPRAKVWLAECYSQGKGGVKQDYKESFKLLNEAYEAEPNNPAMLEKLALAYGRGAGTPADPNKAFTLMSQAVDLGWASACSSLGSYYMKGEGVDKDVKKAAEIYQRGVEGRDAPCMFNYALCLESGRGVNKDDAGAVAMMQRAVDAGFAPAMGFLGTYYMNGYGVPKPDPERAAALYKQGADSQDPLCQFRYAQCLESGNGVPVDKDAAAKLYAASAEKKYQPAVEWLSQHKTPPSRR